MMEMQTASMKKVPEDAYSQEDGGQDDNNMLL